MRIAISYWQNCISPVFDVSQNFLIIDINGNQVAGSASNRLDAGLPFTRVEKLADWGVDVLICGAISRTSEMAVAGRNIELISYIFGTLEDVLPAYLKKQLRNKDEWRVGQKRRRQKRRRNRGK